MLSLHMINTHAPGCTTKTRYWPNQSSYPSRNGAGENSSHANLETLTSLSAAGKASCTSRSGCPNPLVLDRRLSSRTIFMQSSAPEWEDPDQDRSIGSWIGSAPPCRGSRTRRSAMNLEDLAAGSLSSAVAVHGAIH